MFSAAPGRIFSQQDVDVVDATAIVAVALVVALAAATVVVADAITAAATTAVAATVVAVTAVSHQKYLLFLNITPLFAMGDISEVKLQFTIQ